MDPRNQNELSVRRWIDRLKDPGLSELRPSTGRSLYRAQLRHRVVIEKVLVVRILEQVLEGPDRCLLGIVLLDGRAFWSGGGRRRLAARRRKSLDQERALIRHPLERIAVGGVQRDSGDFPGGCARGLGYPKLDSVACGVGEGNVLAIGAPSGAPDDSAGRKNDSPRSPVQDLQERHACNLLTAVRPIGFGIDSQARKPQHGLREIRDGRIFDLLSQKNQIIRRTYGQVRGSGRIKNVQHRLRRFLISRVSLCVSGQQCDQQREAGKQMSGSKIE